MKTLRKILQSGEYAIGSWINTVSPIVAELMAVCEFDFLVVDAEHSAIDIFQTQTLFQAIQSGNKECTSLIRLPDSNYATTKRYMDAGAGGVIAPLVNSAEQAEEVVRAVKYPPQGSRGVGFCRANLYGMRLNEAVASANEHTFVCIQIEHIDGVHQIDKILSVKGIDAVFIGPYDLSASMGITGQFSHKDMAKVEQVILKACQAHKVTPGIHVIQPDIERVVQRYREGYRLIAYSLDITMLLNSCKFGLDKIRKHLPK